MLAHRSKSDAKRASSTERLSLKVGVRNPLSTVHGWFATTRTQLARGCTVIPPVYRRTSSVKNSADAEYGMRSIGSASMNGNS